MPDYFDDLVPQEADQEQDEKRAASASGAFDDLVPEKDDRGSFTRGISSGIDQMESLAYGLGALGADVVGADDFRERMIEGYRRNVREAEHNAPEVSTFEQAKETGRYGSYALGTLGQLVPTMATMVGTGGVGGLIAKTAGKKAVDSYAKTAMKKGLGEKLAQALAQDALKKKVLAGQAAGAALGSIGLSTGEIYGDVADQGAEGAGAILSSIAGGSVAGAIDVLPFMRVARKFGFGDPLKQSITREIYKRVPLEALKQTPLEAGTEAIQTAIEEGTKAFILDHDLPDNIGNMMMEAAIAGGIGGAAMGGLAGIPRQRQATQQDIDARKSFDELHKRVKSDADHAQQPIEVALPTQDLQDTPVNLSPDAGLNAVAEGEQNRPDELALEKEKTNDVRVSSGTTMNPQTNDGAKARLMQIDADMAALQMELDKELGEKRDIGEASQTTLTPKKETRKRAQQKTAKAEKENKAEAEKKAKELQRIGSLAEELNSLSLNEGKQIIAQTRDNKIPLEVVSDVIQKRIDYHKKPRIKQKPVNVKERAVNPDAGLQTQEPEIAAGKKDVKQIFKKAKERPIIVPDFSPVERAYPDERTIDQNDDLKKPENFKEMKAMASRAGWDERGGKVMMDNDGNVLGRTKWLPKETWFAEKPDRVTEKHFRGAIDKLESGKKLTKPERSAAAFMLDYVLGRKAADTSFDLNDYGDEISGLDAFSKELVSLADKLEIVAPGEGESTLERAAIEDLSHAETKKRLQTAIRKASIKSTSRNQAETPKQGQEAVTVDLAGRVDVARQQAADFEREKDAQRNATNKPEPSLLKESPDLFNNSGRLESDLFDQETKPKPERTSPQEGKADKAPAKRIRSEKQEHITHPTKDDDGFIKTISTKGAFRAEDGTTYRVIKTEDKRGFAVEKVNSKGEKSTTRDLSKVGWTIMEARRKALEDHQESKNATGASTNSEKKPASASEIVVAKEDGKQLLAESKKRVESLKALLNCVKAN